VCDVSSTDYIGELIIPVLLFLISWRGCHVFLRDIISFFSSCLPGTEIGNEIFLVARRSS